MKRIESKPAVDVSVKPVPKRSCRKSVGAVLGAEVVTGASSELRSSKSANGAGGGFTAPFGTLSEPPEAADGADLVNETVACEEAALFTK